MKDKEHIPSSPVFFRKIKKAAILLSGGLFLLALLFPAPLRAPGSLAETPNPAKAAWFLLWVQELVGYSGNLVYALIPLGLYFLLLPYLPGNPEARSARWMPGDQWVTSVATLATFLGILLLTIIAMFFRGENWDFVYPF